MKTFKQFFSEGFIHDSEYEKLKHIVEQPPLNFTWQPPEEKEYEYNVFADRPFDTSVDNISRLDSGPNRFALRICDIRHKEFPIHLSYPHVNFHTGKYHFEELVERWNSIRFFQVSQNTFRHADSLSRQIIPTMHWDEFNYYQSVQGSKIEKIIKTMEFMKAGWQESGIWDYEMDQLILRLRLQYTSKDQISKRDMIRGAITL